MRNSILEFPSTSGIYKITSPTGKVYVGEATNLYKRCSYYLTPNRVKGQRAIYNSLVKHGVDSHTIEVLELCSSEELLDKERYYQEYYCSVEKGLNCYLTPTLVKNSSTSARALRFFTVYGPWGRPDMAYFRMIANVISGSEFNFYGDGSIERDFTYIEDAVNSIIALMDELQTREPSYSDVVNLGGGRPLSMNYLLETVGEITNKKVLFNRFDANSSDAKKTMSNSNYIQSLIGTKPKIKLEDGIAETIKWAQRKDISEKLDKWVKSVK